MANASVGFLWVEIDGEQFTGEFYDKAGQLLYRRCFTRQIDQTSPEVPPIRTPLVKMTAF